MDLIIDPDLVIDLIIDIHLNKLDLVIDLDPINDLDLNLDIDLVLVHDLDMNFGLVIIHHLVIALELPPGLNKYLRRH